jgi:hypothetical protein
MPGVVAGVQFFLTSSLYSITGSTFFAINGAKVLVGLAGSFIGSALAGLFVSTPKATEITRELSSPTIKPPYRFVYGTTRAVGTPVGTPVVGEYIYGCWLVNSRESEGPFSIYLDKREVLFTGDPYDFTEGGGASATEDPFLDHFQFWIQKGDKTTPPFEFTDEAPFVTSTAEDLWKTTDGWQGRTVVWAKVRAGSNGERQERWPSSPPTLELQGPFSKVWDMRDEAQSSSDKSTWTHSDNWALCVNDALMNNPIKGYQEKNLLLDMIAESADISDELFALNAGGTEKNLVVSGTLVFRDAEIEDLISPMLMSGGGSVVRSGGKLGILAPKYRAPTLTVTEIFGDSFSAVDLAPSDEMVTTLITGYLSSERGYEEAELAPYSIPGALVEDGGIESVRNLDLTFCPSSTQAGRLRKMYGGLLRRQKKLEVVLPPEAFNNIVGSTITLDLVEPLNIFNGIYEILAINPGFDIAGENGVSLLMPATLVKHDESIYDWDETVDEEDIIEQEYVGEREAIAAPTNFSSSLDYINTGGTFLPELTFSFDASTSFGVESYEWLYSIDEAPFLTGGTIVDGATSDSLIVDQTKTYEFRVRAVTASAKSGFLESAPIDVDITISSIVVTGGSSAITFEGTSPIAPTFGYIKVFSAATDDFGASTEFNQLAVASPNSTFSETFPQSAGTLFYWLVPYYSTDAQGTVSDSYERVVT